MTRLPPAHATAAKTPSPRGRPPSTKLHVPRPPWAPVQLKSNGAPPPAAEAAPNLTGLPDGLKAGVEALSGLAMDDVRVHRNSSEPAKLGALGYAKGTDIHLGPGQEQHLPHEAWHVVQQKQGLVAATAQMKSGVAINDEAALEREADVMGARAATAERRAVPLGSDLPHGAVRPVAQRAPGTGTGVVVQRQLIANGAQYEDTRDTAAPKQQFRPIGGGPVAAGPAPTGDYTDGPYNYRYDAATWQYRVTTYPGEVYWDVAEGREFTREVNHRHNDIHRYIHRYIPGVDTPFENNVSYAFRYLPNHQYDRALTKRARWVDAFNRFVEDPGNPRPGDPNPKSRVLTQDERGIEKQYGVGKVGREFVIPYKPVKPVGPDFLDGLPNLHGGNVDHGETDSEPLAREIREESGDRYALAHSGAVLADFQDVPPRARNRYQIIEAALTERPPDAHRDRHEMAGEMRFTPSHFVGHTANQNMTMQRLFDLFSEQVAGNPAHAADLARHAGIAPADWAESHSMAALGEKIRADVGRYRAGRDLARSSQPADATAGPDHAQGHAQYQQGVADARVGGAAQPAEPAHAMGHGDYVAGLAAVRASLPTGFHNGALAAAGDYLAGLAAAQPGGGAIGIHHANIAAFNEYNAGHADGVAGAQRANQNVAYAAGYNAGSVPAGEVPKKRQKI